MSINACSINGFTLNGKRCSDKFAELIPIFRPPVPPVTTIQGNPRVLRDTFARPTYDIDDTPKTYEQPFVTVSVEFLGKTGSETQNVNDAQLDFVSVTNLKIETSVKPEIEISIGELYFD